MSIALDERRSFRTGHLADQAFRAVTMAFAVAVLLVLVAVVVTLAVGSLPALEKFKLGFFTSAAWNPVTNTFGALAPVWGTLVSSLIAILVGVPVSFGIALFLTEMSPLWLRRPVGMAVELLAAIPSIIYGMWGLFVFAPFYAAHVQPLLTTLFGGLPFFGALFDGPPLGIGMSTAGLILAAMIVPFISSVMRDVFETVPSVLKEAAYGIGATTWEVVWRIVLPYTRTGVMGGIMLGLGRALGETMAVTFVVGNSHHITASLFMPGTTISAAIANEFTEAVGNIYASSLMALGLTLFFITFVVLALAKLMLQRLGGPR